MLTDTDIDALAEALEMEPRQLINQYTRLTPNRCQLALRDKGDGFCVFLEDGYCRVYEARPEQCRNFPFTGRVAEECPALDELKAATEKS